MAILMRSKDHYYDQKQPIYNILITAKYILNSLVEKKPRKVKPLGSEFQRVFLRKRVRVKC